MEGLNNIKDEAKMFILRDFEIAKQIAMLRYTQKEQSAKFIKLEGHEKVMAWYEMGTHETLG
ncbi:hypothetical protein NXX38_26565 (plasmid) [Bacteroides sp. BFG-637]|uniref:hypothetical protein n=1 Tax=Bacteroides sp. BFG-637 TaxID=2972764 RepID=UPI0021668950|nr:hypothetical protein [Bacteroides sp. BFG-637]MCS3315196.1 hypothetical protein [Bacteroides sp. BFG-637]